jgi:alpha-tubulin suppressor-like RCC1 family protein
MKINLKKLTFLMFSIILAACGGGSKSQSQTYTISGNVIGLAAGALVVLANNNSNQTTITSNGAFTFSVPIAENGGFNVTVATQPASQTCVLTNGSGSNISSNVSNVTVTCTASNSGGGSTTIPSVIWSSVAVGGGHVMAIKSNGTLWAWGRNNAGQLGDGTVINKSVPIQISNEMNWKAVSAGEVHTVAMKSDGSLWAWGHNVDGRLGNNSTNRSLTPIRISTESDWIAISAGQSHTLALKQNGTIWGWGGNDYGQTGGGTLSPAKIGTDNDWKALSSGTAFSLALKSNGSLWAWGRISNTNIPSRIGSEFYDFIAAGHSHALAIRRDLRILQWGLNNYYNQMTALYTSPTVMGTNSWKLSSAGISHNLAIDVNGDLWSWGSNNTGQLGDGTNISRSSPIKLSGTWVAVSASAHGISNSAFNSTSVGIKSDGTLWAWGDNSEGQLGDGTTANSNVPKKIN